MADSAPRVCWPWHLSFLEDEPVQGMDCTDCRKPVAVPMSAGKAAVVCTYCGMARGLVDMQDRPFA